MAVVLPHNVAEKGEWDVVIVNVDACGVVSDELAVRDKAHLCRRLKVQSIRCVVVCLAVSQCKTGAIVLIYPYPVTTTAVHGRAVDRYVRIHDENSGRQRLADKVVGKDDRRYVILESYCGLDARPAAKFEFAVTDTRCAAPVPEPDVVPVTGRRNTKVGHRRGFSSNGAVTPRGEDDRISRRPFGDQGSVNLETLPIVGGDLLEFDPHARFDHERLSRIHLEIVSGNVGPGRDGLREGCLQRVENFTIIDCNRIVVEVARDNVSINPIVIRINVSQRPPDGERETVPFEPVVDESCARAEDPVS